MRMIIMHNVLQIVLVFNIFFMRVMTKIENSNNIPDEYVIKIDGLYSDAKSVAYKYNLKLIGKVVWYEKQEYLKRTKRSQRYAIYWNDPLYNEMWYLIRASKGLGYDMNVLEAWNLGYTGKDVKITIMDDGLDYTHPDLVDSYDPMASTDLNDRDDDPMPDLKNRDNKHGTRCAGQIAAKGNNSLCIVGIAPNAKIGGIRMLDGLITDRVEAEALSFHQNYIDIYSGSWGPEDSGILYEGPGVLAQSAFQKGVVSGRKGFGNIYVWASGNGGSHDDSCACDGYASNLFTLSVSGVGELNSRPWYLERCSSTLISTYSSGSSIEKMIATIDLGNSCTVMHTGTSASAPMAAGIIALLLEANNRLNWRDVQYITLLTANTKPFIDGNFTRNSAGRLYSNLYGYGLMDAGKMVRLGKLWRNVPPHHRCTTTVLDVKRSLIGRFNHTVFIEFSGCQTVNNSNSNRMPRSFSEHGTPVVYLESVQIYADIVYQRRGLLQITIVSPSGTESVIYPPRIKDAYSGNIAMLRWPVTTVQLWGEPANGTWQIRLDNLLGSELVNLDPEFIRGFWRSVWIVAYGTEEFPIRLKPPPSNEPKPPEEWFSQFSKYVVRDNDWLKVFSCHSECAAGGCSGPAADQCSFGCKHFATESRKCVAECPPGTTALGSLRNQNNDFNKNLYQQKSLGRLKPSTSNRIRSNQNYENMLYNDQSFRNEIICQSCLSLCASCIRSQIEYDCTSCSKGRFLIPFIQPQDSAYPNANDRIRVRKSGTNFKLQLPSLVGTCRSECPTGYYGNLSVSVCMPCAINCDVCLGPHSYQCVKPTPGYLLINNTLFDIMSEKIKCSPGYYLKGSKCTQCHESCNEFGCIQENQCNWCPPDKPNYWNSTCINRCPSGWYSGELMHNPLHIDTLNGTTDGIGAVYEVRLCESCSPGCLKCANLTLCHECSGNLTLIQGMCMATTSVEYNNNRSADCLESVNDGLSTSCLVCKDDMILFPNPISPSETMNEFSVIVGNDSRTHNVATKNSVYYSCVDKCPIGYFYAKQIVNISEQSDKIKRVIPDQILNRTSITTQLCRPCPIFCSSCIDMSKCLSCQSGFHLDMKLQTCRLSQKCMSSEYFDIKLKRCISCDPSCRTCFGPLADQCTSCSRKMPNPRCLSESSRTMYSRWATSINEHSRNNYYTRQQLLNSIMQHDSPVQFGDDEPVFGRCVNCCFYKFALTDRNPTDCMFCVADKIKCLHGDEIGAGEGGLQLEQISVDSGLNKSNNNNSVDSGTEMNVTSGNVYIFGLAALFTSIALILLVLVLIISVNKVLQRFRQSNPAVNPHDNSDRSGAFVASKLATETQDDVVDDDGRIITAHSGAAAGARMIDNNNNNQVNGNLVKLLKKRNELFLKRKARRLAAASQTNQTSSSDEEIKALSVLKPNSDTNNSGGNHHLFHSASSGRKRKI